MATGRLAGAFLLGSLISSIAAAVLIPTTLLDEDGTNPGACSLREAVATVAGGAGYGGCPAPLDGVVELGTGTYEVSLPDAVLVAVTDPARLADGVVLRGAGRASTRIAGTGPAVGGLLRIASPAGGPHIEVRELALVGGRESGLSLDFLVGVELLIEDVDFRDNHGGLGGALQVQGSMDSFSFPSRLTFRRVRFEGNQARGEGGAVFCADSVEAEVPITLWFEEVVFLDNRVQSGPDQGGAGGGHLASLGCSVEARGVTFAGGVAESEDLESYGGGVTLALPTGTPTARFENVTFWGNAAHRGGALYATGAGPIEMVNVTFSANSAPGGGDHLAANSDRAEGLVLARNVLFGTGGTDASDCAAIDGDGAAVDSAGGNLDGDGTCGLDGPGDQPGVADPGVASGLAELGGFSPTLALLRGSAAIDRSIDGFPPTDQRGQARPIDGDLDGSALADVGAFETLPLVAPVQEIPALGPAAALLLGAALGLGGLRALRGRRRSPGGPLPLR